MIAGFFVPESLALEVFPSSTAFPGSRPVDRHPAVFRVCDLTPRILSDIRS